MAAKAKRLLGLQDHDTHMAIIQSMQAELKRINARRLWDYAARCVLSELGARMPHHLFRQRVLKNRRVRAHCPLAPTLRNRHGAGLLTPFSTVSC